MAVTLTDRILDLKDYAGEDGITTSVAMLDEIKKQKVPPAYKSNIPSLDELTGGFECGELIAISGPRKSGKTLLAQTITTNLEKQKILSLWFSYEVTPREFFRRFGDTAPFFLLPNKLKANSLDWIRDRICEAVAKYGISVVFIDHLHFLFDIAKTRNASMEVGQVIRYLKMLAVELEIVIVVMCHMRKTDPTREPSDEDFRDSSLIAQETDTAFIVWRTADKDNTTNVKVCYHRRTGVFEKKFELIKVGDLLREPAYGYGAGK